MPRIDAPTLAEHREQRRDALLEAATTVMRESGTVTMSAVAERTGLSRTAVYEYYRSSADLIADVLVDELAAWIDHLAEAIDGIADPRERLVTWIRAALAYVEDGRHALVRAAGDATLPPVRRAQVQTLHRDLAAPVYVALREIGVTDAERIASYVWGVVEAATRHIESGRAADDEVDAAIAFALAGVDLACST
ncbi:MAG: TetR/AcrR family transcriptional regulator [Candidatus Nanopelagicales bacterium]|jgi:AcrR family transcriptional regulator|nr:TetR/AcrR family transcriptional regulator [Candidatus Nanopelagicales bacterium]MDP4975606.1 TetR/AcrR family transcriptional regulator [Candidatus Nanopelagicales bacterium]